MKNYVEIWLDIVYSLVYDEDREEIGKMKKTIIGILLTTLMLFMPTMVSAKSLIGEGELEINNQLGNLVTFEKSYDEENDVTNVHTVLTINEEVLNTVLAQRPGVGGNLGVFYLGITPTSFKGMAEHKQANIAFAKNTDIATVKAELNEKVANKAVDTSKDPSTWVYGVAIQYFKDGKWNIANTSGNGITSIGENLVSLLGLNSIDELKYGENYRVFMYEEYDWYIEYQEVGNELANTQYVKVSYEIKFPVTASFENGIATYYPTLKSALDSGSKNIVINEDIILTDELVLEDGVNVTIANGKTLTLADTAKLIINSGAKLDVSENAKLVVNENASIEINGEITGLKNADYTALNKLIEQIEVIKKAKNAYTKGSYQKFEELLKTLTYDFNLLEIDQAKVDEMVSKTKEVINELELIADYSKVYALLDTVTVLDQGLYTDESYQNLMDAINAIDSFDLGASKQNVVDGYEKNITESYDELEYRPADYSKVNKALSKVNAKEIESHKKLYTAKSYNRLVKAISDYEKGLLITEQDKVDEIATEITLALKGLKIKSADYSEVNAIVKKAENINKTEYTEESIKELEAAVKDVVKGKPITDQNEVDEMAKRLANAYNNLAKKEAVKEADKAEVAKSNNSAIIYIIAGVSVLIVALIVTRKLIDNKNK